MLQKTLAIHKHYVLIRTVATLTVETRSAHVFSKPVRLLLLYCNRAEESNFILTTKTMLRVNDVVGHKRREKSLLSSSTLWKTQQWQQETTAD